MLARLRSMSNETRAGLLLALAAIAGVLSENIGALKPTYEQFLSTYITLSVGDAAISKPILLWINDALMAVFFFLIALEIKKEILEGSLSEWRKAALPVYGAIGGMVVPALVFLAIVGIGSAEAVGWAIPAATDIAFALGVLSLFGSRVPTALKAFLLALAVVDDLGAIVIIAMFYTSNLSLAALALGAIGLAVLGGMNVAGFRRKAPFILVGIFLWVCVLKSGVHATLAGVALGFAIPMADDEEGRSPLKTLEHGLHPYVAYFVMPIFAYANAGVPLGGLTLADMVAPLTLAITLGLFVGKQIGVFGCAWGAIRLGLAEPPKGASLAQLYGVSLLAGIGFTMSLFIGTLAFSDPQHQNAVRLGVLAGSILSGVVGAIVLARANSASSKVPAAAQTEGGQPAKRVAAE